MQLTQVKSSNLSAIGYDPKSKVLEVEFIGGARWQYFDVPVSVWEGLRSARSHGVYFHREIRTSFRSAQVG